MNKEQLAELRRLAEKATKGTWEAVEIGDFNCVCSTAKMAVISHDYKSMMSVNPDDDIKYIAAANPSAILQLLDYIETLEKDALISHLQFALADTEALELGTAERLASSQAREQQLREALEKLSLYVAYNGDDWVQLREKEALALPTDTTALQSLIAKAGEVMRNRMVASGFSQPHEEYFGCIIQLTIKSLPPITLEDLQK